MIVSSQNVCMFNFLKIYINVLLIVFYDLLLRQQNLPEQPPPRVCPGAGQYCLLTRKLGSSASYKKFNFFSKSGRGRSCVDYMAAPLAVKTF